MRRRAATGPVCVWLTGLPASGKTTLAKGMVSHAVSAGLRASMVDGDEVREQFRHDLGFSRDDRLMNAWRIAEIACSHMETTDLVVVASVSPYREARDTARRQIAMCGRFVEVWVATPLAVCELRDVKGLYERARRGELIRLTGLDAPYEPPLLPDAVLDASACQPEVSSRRLLDALVLTPHS